MSLRDGLKKMSKSDESSYSRIDLKDSKDEIVKKIKKAKTDSMSIPDNLKELETKPEALNLINIYSDLIGKSSDKVLDDIKGKEYSFLKNKLTEVLIEKICPIGIEIKKLMNERKYLEEILKEGSKKARSIADHNLKEIKNIIGFF